jgi:predicted GH43/DUF377 family glycosyl hydrolase
MWFHAYEQYGPDLEYHIGYANSPDGITWDKYAGNPVLKADTAAVSWERGLYSPNVVYHDGIFHMWYVGISDAYNAFVEIGHATSPDGINWTKDSLNPVIKRGGLFGTCYPMVIYDGSQFRMWYAQIQGFDWNIIEYHYATSSDGSNWDRRDNPVMLPDSDSWENRLFDLSIVFRENKYQMWYTEGFSGIFDVRYATSSDGLTWTKTPDLVLENNISGWESYGVGQQTVLYDEIYSMYKMWYVGATAATDSRIGYAWSADATDIAKNYNCSAHDTYVPVGSDVLVTAEIVEPSDQSIVVNALLQSTDGSVSENFQMYDDGNHSDGAADDGIYGTNCNLGSAETEYYNYVTVLLENDDVTLSSNNNSFFTTKGPLEIDNYEFTSDITEFSPGTRPRFQINLINSGLLGEIKNVDVELIIPENAGFKETTTGVPVWGDIGPGEIVGNTNRPIAITVNDTCQIGHYDIVLEISSDNKVWWYDTLTIDIVTDVEDELSSLPNEFALDQNYPNPFNPSTTIKYSIPKAVKSLPGEVTQSVTKTGERSIVNLTIYDVLGREVATLVNEHQGPGNYQVSFDASLLSSGVYFYKLTAGKHISTKKMLMIK